MKTISWIHCFTKLPYDLSCLCLFSTHLTLFNAHLDNVYQVFCSSGLTPRWVVKELVIYLCRYESLSRTLAGKCSKVCRTRQERAETFLKDKNLLHNIRFRKCLHFRIVCFFRAYNNYQTYSHTMRQPPTHSLTVPSYRGYIIINYIGKSEALWNYEECKLTKWKLCLLPQYIPWPLDWSEDSPAASSSVSEPSWLCPDVSGSSSGLTPCICDWITSILSSLLLCADSRCSIWCLWWSTLAAVFVCWPCSAFKVAALCWTASSRFWRLSPYSY